MKTKKKENNVNEIKQKMRVIFDYDENDEYDNGDVADENDDSARHEHEGAGKSSSPAAG